MQRLAAVVVMVVVGLTALVSVGCVAQDKYDAVMLKNREQEKMLQEKDAQVVQLTERVNAQAARMTDVTRIIAEKDDHLASLQRRYDAFQSAYNQLLALYPKLAERPVTGAGISGPVMSQLQALADQYKDIIELNPATGELRFKADVTFDSGSNMVKPQARDAIAKLAAILASDAGKSIRIDVTGHTDTDAVKLEKTITLLKTLKKAPNNQGLSEARAEAVAEILKTGKVDAGRMTTKGAGESQPMADNKTVDGKAKNRRVEIFLTGNAAPATAPAPAAAGDLPLGR
jgi:outer membrane protein OmpA-like peptidoglycan-associated protein